MINYQELLDYLNKYMDAHYPSDGDDDGVWAAFETAEKIKQELIRNHEAYMKSLTDKSIKENLEALQKLGDK